MSPAEPGPADPVEQEFLRLATSFDQAASADEAASAGEPAPEPSAPPSVSNQLETFFTRQAVGDEAFFERLNKTRSFRRDVRRTAGAIEIGLDAIQFLELSPSGDRLVASRFTTVTLARAEGMSATTRMAIVGSALEVLRERIGGTFPPCTVVWNHGSTQAQVLMVHPGTRRLQRLVRGTLGQPGGERGTVSHRRVLGNLRVGNERWKTVLATRAVSGELELVKAALDRARVPLVRLATSPLIFLETIVPLLARSDEDMAEVFLLLDARALTIALAARAEILTSRTYPMVADQASFGFPVFQMQFLGHLKQAAREFTTALGGATIARVRYMSTLTDQTPFPAREVAARLGCTPEIIDPELAFKVDPESLDEHQVPASVRSALVPAAFEATLRPASWIDLGAPEARVASTRRMFWAVNALAAIAIVCGLSYSTSRKPTAQLQKALDSVAARRAELARVEGLIADRDELLARSQRARAVARDEDLVAEALATTPDYRALFAALDHARPAGVSYEQVRFTLDPGTRRWAVDLLAQAVGEQGPDTARALVDGLGKAAIFEELSWKPATKKPDVVRVEIHLTLAEVR